MVLQGQGQRLYERQSYAVNDSKNNADGRAADARQAASADRLRAGKTARAAAGKPKSQCHAMGVAYEDGRAGTYKQSCHRAA